MARTSAELIRNAEMDNGASVSDWLGTASVAANGAGRYLEYVRHNQTQDPTVVLDRAQDLLQQAMDELRAVRLRTGV